MTARKGAGRSRRRAAAFACAVAAFSLRPAPAQQGIVSTAHNLSVSGKGAIHSSTETEICKFCHIPHNAVVPVPLWSRETSRAQYEVPRVRDRHGNPQPVPQPDGSSRLCLSCHDGTIALGEVGRGRRPISMVGGERLAPGRRGYLGTDLSGSHPVSFVVPAGDPAGRSGPGDMGMKPLTLIRTDRQVRLDSQNKMQCTTCHDPHSDQYYQTGRVPHFWVKPTLEEVCLTCHELP